MGEEKKFDYRLSDSQGTVVEPLAPEDFDIEAYCDYEASLAEDARAFWEADSGLAVYRRFRVPVCFSYACQDMNLSLSLQLAALKKSMDFKADVPNFLEPWYGVGTVSSAFGIDYEWNEGQAPGFKAPFASVKDALDHGVVSVAETAIGKRTLEMIEFFLDKTGGKIPMSLTDTQSPLNTASLLVDANAFFLEMLENPDGINQLLSTIADLLVEFTKKQAELIGDALVWPGHGFPSARSWDGLGMSADVIAMLSPQQYGPFEAPHMTKAGEPFGGPVFHSCGDWSKKIEAVKPIPSLKMVDGAFSAETDPDHCPAQPFADSFTRSGIAVNARVVGDFDTIVNKTKLLWKPGMKLALTTYCQTPEEQERVYDAAHEIAGA